MSRLPAIRPIPHWRAAWRLWSVRLSAAGAALMATWTQLPPDLRAALPHADRVAALLFAAVALSRLLAQPESRA